jgi:hypothetical protein
MNMNKNFFAGLFVGLGLLAIVAFKPTESKPEVGAQKWDYQTLVMGWGSKLDVKLKELGQEGWELAGVGQTGGYIFKKPID